MKRLINERQAASNCESCRTICDDVRIIECAMPWPVESQRAQRGDLPNCDAVVDPDDGCRSCWPMLWQLHCAQRPR